jgi:hypothetical protein
MKWIAAALIIFTTLSLSLAWGQGNPSGHHFLDSYNYYQWNRVNHKLGIPLEPHVGWYEWWYYKVIEPKTGHSFLFTYGVVNPWDKNQTKKASAAFITFGSFNDKILIEEKLKPSEFSASYDQTLVQVGSNVATDGSLSGSVKDAHGNAASWNLVMSKRFSANVMGWIMPVPGISNIYWYPAQGSAFMSGTIDINGRRYVLDNAPAYQDRNWGFSFPKWWAWLVADQFKNSPGTVLLAGGGKPKILNAVEILDGMNIVFHHKGRNHAFRKIDGNVIFETIRFGKWKIKAFNEFGESISIEASAPRDKFMDLPFTTPNGRVFHDMETLNGNIKVILRFMGKKIAEVETDQGGIEYGSESPHWKQ